jgi:hypothetical protein
MRRSLLIGIVAVVALVAGAVLYFTVFAPNDDSCTTENEGSERAYSGIEAEIKRDTVCEVLVDLGRVRCSDTVVKNIRLVNKTDAPIALLEYQTTCRCTWLTLPNTAIAPNDYADIELTFDSRGEFGSIGNFLSIETSDESVEVVVWMSADIE